MDKRLLLAILLVVGVFLLSEVLFPTPKRVPPTSIGADSGSGRRPPDTSGVVARRDSPSTATRTTLGASRPAAAPSVALLPDERATVVTPKATYTFGSAGAQPLTVTLRDFASLAHGTNRVTLAAPDGALLTYRLLIGADTVAADQGHFALERRGTAGNDSLTFRGAIGGGTVAMEYTFSPDSYIVRVRGSVKTPLARALLIDLPHALQSEEADSLDDQRHLAYAYKPSDDNAKIIPFGKLTPGVTSPPVKDVSWVVAKNKYFLVGILAPVGSKPLAGLIATGGPRVSKLPTRAAAMVVIQLDSSGAFAFEMFTGPQEWRRLVAVGRDFEHANPYGGFMQGVVQPFATIVISILLWLHETLRLNYGWALVFFGVAIRIILWPLYQSSMRTSIRMQRIQPEIQEVQQRLKSNPTKQHEEMMRVYKEHGMTPFSPMMGCLPALIPMPILFALFFVFQNTIEFRGVSFLWLPDIAQKDPFYILPLVMGGSMFALSWIGMRNAPPNPQGKMLQYLLPVMMTVFFLNFASGLNLYYAVQNLAAFPQQWLIAAERAKVAPAKSVARAKPTG
jgi:YidC/Oxa1 family membrane protein insertase